MSNDRSISKKMKKTKSQAKSPGIVENQNQSNNSVKQAKGPNTER